MRSSRTFNTVHDRDSVKLSWIKLSRKYRGHVAVGYTVATVAVYVQDNTALKEQLRMYVT